MNTIPHHAPQDNPQKKSTIYGIAEPSHKDYIIWKDIRYIGMSTNVTARFVQHLMCADEHQQEKNEWILGLLAQDSMPRLHKIEEEIGSLELGRKREQYWIRYAMSQGASLFNRAITYTEEERYQAKIYRAMKYAKMGAILEQGIFVKQPDAWYSPNLRKCMEEAGERIRIYEVFDVFFLNEQGILVNLVESPDKDFDVFIRRYIPIWEQSGDAWGWEDRLSAIQFAKVFGKSPELHKVPSPPKPVKQKKSKRK